MGCCIGDCGFCCIVDCCIGDFCSDTPCSYHPRHDDHTVETTINTSNELAEMRNRANKEGQELGEAVFRNINVYMSQFLEHLEKINTGVYGGKKLNIDMETIRRDIDELKSTVKNFIGDKINERLVKTDPELSLIFEERDSAKRKRNFDQFYTKIHKAAVKSLITDIEEIIGGEFVIIEKQIRSRLKEVNDTVKRTQKEYEAAAKMIEKEDAKIAEKQVEYMYQIAIADILNDELRRE